MILVYNDHTDADPNPVRVGDEVDTLEGTLRVSEICPPAAGRPGLVYCVLEGMTHKALLPLHILKAKWVDEPVPPAPTLDQLFDAMVAAQRAYHLGLRHEMRRLAREAAVAEPLIGGVR